MQSRGRVGCRQGRGWGRAYAGSMPGQVKAGQEQGRGKGRPVAGSMPGQGRARAGHWHIRGRAMRLCLACQCVHSCLGLQSYNPHCSGSHP